MRKADSKKILIVFFLNFFISCNTDNKQQEKTTKITAVQQSECVRRFMSADDSLGKIRNHACETISLSQSIHQYVQALRNLDYRICLPAFQEAVDKHLDAWQNMKKITDRYPDLRGEMHALFDQLEKSKDSAIFKPLLDKIWDTWAGVEDYIK